MRKEPQVPDNLGSFEDEVERVSRAQQGAEEFLHEQRGSVDMRLAFQRLAGNRLKGAIFRARHAGLQQGLTATETGNKIQEAMRLRTKQ